MEIFNQKENAPPPGRRADTPVLCPHGTTTIRWQAKTPSPFKTAAVLTSIVRKSNLNYIKQKGDGL
jgi:hypothetical protein